MFTLLTFDTVNGSHSDAPGEAMGHSSATALHSAVLRYATDHGDLWEVHERPLHDGAVSYHVTLWADKPLNLAALADIARDYGQDAIGVLQGSTLVGPGLADYPTTVKPSSVA